jgi:hypothetical protein
MLNSSPKISRDVNAPIVKIVHGNEVRRHALVHRSGASCGAGDVRVERIATDLRWTAGGQPGSIRDRIGTGE